MNEEVKIIINGFATLVLILYLFFCLFLNCVAKPSDNNHVKSISMWHFKEEPTGFVLISLWIGRLILISILIAIIGAICYAIGSDILS